MKKMVYRVKSDSCDNCELAFWDRNDDYVCFHNNNSVDEYEGRRAPWCPLEEVVE